MKTLVNTKHILSAVGAVLVAGASMAAHAQPSNPIEFRGYSMCVGAAEEQVSGLVTTREYFINRSASKNQYFINGTAWASGDRVAVRVACETSRSGRKLLDLAVDEGRFVLDDGSVSVRVAAN